MDDYGYYDERMTGITAITGMTGITWMTAMTHTIRINRMTINEMTWMAGMTRVTMMRG